MREGNPPVERVTALESRWSPRAQETRIAPRPSLGLAFDAVARSVLCFATLHAAIVLAAFTMNGDARALNVFTMLEAQRLWPELATAPASPWWSLVFTLAVYRVVYASLARAVRASEPPDESAALPDTPAVQHRTVVRAMASVSTVARSLYRPSLVAGIAALVGGLALHMTGLALVERFVKQFPPVPDVLHAHLPYVDFGVPGELLFVAFLVTLIAVLVRTQPRSIPVILTPLGVFYAIRGAFLFALPIGIPPTAPPLEARFVFYPFAGHAYFPGGHTGMMTVLSLSVASRPWRRVFLVTTFAFAFGTLLSRTHYTADAIGGWLVGYAIVQWGRRHMEARAGRQAAAVDDIARPAAQLFSREA